MKKLSIVPFLVVLVGLGLLASVALAKPQAPLQNTDITKKAYEVLEKKCGECHGKDRSGKFTFHDYKAMVDNGHITPGKPDESRLFIRAAKSPGDPMPPTYAKDPAPLTANEKAALKTWIEAGAPQMKTEQPAAPRKFLSETDILREIENDLTAAKMGDRPYFRYFTLTHLANAGASEDDIQAFRVGLSKLINSLSWQKKIAAPQPIDSGKTILRIDMRRYSWTEATWKKLLAAYPYGVISESETAKTIYATTNCPLPYVRADWFVSRAALPPLYHELLDLPDTAGKLEAKLGVDVDKNLKEETALRAGLQESGVSRNNRVVERHESPYGAYWRSYDFRNNAGKENIFKNPLGFEAAGGEIIFNLPNGLQAYLLVNGKGDRIDVGPIDIVSNKENANDPTVRNGLTCMSCHAQGMKRFSDSMRAVINATPKAQADYDHDHALALYVEKPKMDAALKEDAKRFADAVLKTGAELSAREPIYALQGRYDSTVDITQAASEAGLPAEIFLSKLQASPRLGALLGLLKTAGGRLKRDAWEEYFGDVVQELHLGIVLKLAPNSVALNSKTNSLSIVTPLPIQPAQFKKNKIDGADMVYIPAGEFTMGDDKAIFESPAHNVTLDSYYIYKTPVTVGQYKQFCTATSTAMPFAPAFNRNWSKENYPIVDITWDEAQAYCKWAKVRLPTEAEWEKAASWDEAKHKQRIYPWGDEWDSSKLVCAHYDFYTNEDSQKPVGSCPLGASYYGVLDMEGNVEQMCSDCYDLEFYKSHLATERNAKN